MGQYHKLFNLDKKEFVHAHQINNGLKLMEQCGPMHHVPSTSDALWLLLANSNGRGGGDAKQHDLIGAWAGDRIVVQGDYAEESDQSYIYNEDLFSNISESIKQMLDYVFADE
jgi:hypothetical protein